MCVTTIDMLCRTSVTKLLAWLIYLRCVHDRLLFIKLQGFGLLMHVRHHVSTWSCRASVAKLQGFGLLTHAGCTIAGFPSRCRSPDY